MGGTTRGPLAGVRVVELGGGIAAPVCGRLLADQGADVVRIVAATDPALPGSGPGEWLRGKRTVALDPDRGEDRAALGDLLDGADVVVDGRASPGADPRVGRPGLIRVALSPFAPGSGGDGSAFEGTFGALVGLYDPPIGRTPGFNHLPAASMVAAMYGAAGAVAALIARRRDGRGQTVEVPLSDAALAAQELAAALLIGAPRSWRTLQWAATPFIAPYRASDGWIYVHAGLGPHLARLVDALRDAGSPEAEALRATLSEATLADPSRPRSVSEAAKAGRLLAAAFARRSAAAWEEDLGDAGLCVVQVRDPADWRRHEQPRATGEIEQSDGRARLGAAVRVGGRRTVGDARVAKASTVAKSWKVRAGAPGDIDASAPLAGVRVLDLTQVIAGPVAARTLAELGADVVRVENPKFVAGWVEAFHTVFNPGKRSVGLDLSTSTGRAALFRLFGRFKPDVVVHNWRPGAAEALGLGEDALRAVLPDVVYVHLSAYGPDGPWGRRPGWEQTAQAVTGTQRLHGGAGAPDVLPVPLNDVGTGLLGAFGALCALWHRLEGGGAVRVETWLTAASVWLQSATLFDDDGRDRRAAGPGALGFEPWHRWYRAKDGWMLVAAASADHLVPLLGASEPAAWEARFGAEPVATWVERARGTDVAVVRRVALRDAFARAASRGAARIVDHPGLGPIHVISAPWRFSGTPLPELPATRPRGADGPEVLGAIGREKEAVLPSGSEPLSGPRRWARDARWVAAQVRWGAFLAWSRRRR